MISSPYSTFAADRGHGFPIGSTYEVITPARLAYWAPDEWIEQSTSTRRAMACPWSPPSPKSEPISAAEMFAAMFGES
jgi:hypothetical protein